MERLPADAEDSVALAEAEVYVVGVPDVEPFAFGDNRLLREEEDVVFGIEVPMDEVREREFFINADGSAAFQIDIVFDECFEDDVCFHLICEF